MHLFSLFYIHYLFTKTISVYMYAFAVDQYVYYVICTFTLRRKWPVEL